MATDQQSRGLGLLSKSCEFKGWMHVENDRHYHHYYYYCRGRYVSSSELWRVRAKALTALRQVASLEATARWKLEILLLRFPSLDLPPQMDSFISFSLPSHFAAFNRETFCPRRAKSVNSPGLAATAGVTCVGGPGSWRLLVSGWKMFWTCPERIRPSSLEVSLQGFMI